MGFDFSQAELKNYEDDIIIPTGVVIDYQIDTAEEIAISRGFSCKLPSANQYNIFRNRDYIEKGDIVDNPMWIIWPQSRTYQLTRRSYNQKKDEALKQLEDRKEYLDNGWAIIYIDQNVSAESVIKTMIKECEEQITQKNRHSNFFNIFVFEKFSPNAYKFAGVYCHHMYKSDNYIYNETYQKEQMYDRYYFSNGKLTLVLNSFDTEVFFKSGLKSRKYPFIFSSDEASVCKIENLASLADKLKEATNSKSFRLISDKQIYSFSELSELCTQIKMMCEFFCVNIYLVFNDKYISDRYPSTKDKAIDFVREIRRIDSLIYACFKNDNTNNQN